MIELKFAGRVPIRSRGEGRTPVSCPGRIIPSVRRRSDTMVSWLKTFIRPKISPSRMISPLVAGFSDCSGGQRKSKHSRRTLPRNRSQMALAFGA